MIELRRSVGAARPAAANEVTMLVTKAFATATVVAAIFLAACLYAWPKQGEHSELTAAAFALVVHEVVVTAVCFIWGL